MAHPTSKSELNALRLDFDGTALLTLTFFRMLFTRGEPGTT
jgi:hypothetical protein